MVLLQKCFWHVVKDQEIDKKQARSLLPLLVACCTLPIAMIVAATQVTIFVIQPIGAVPEGKTLVISRMSNTKFIDSADAICERTQGGVSLFCRLGALGGTLENAHIYLRLPYMQWLYQISTNGKNYDR
jgi:hypothetical protein